MPVDQKQLSDLQPNIAFAVIIPRVLILRTRARALNTLCAGLMSLQQHLHMFNDFPLTK